MRDLTPAYFVFDHLYLCALAAIYQVIASIMRYDLACGMTIKSRYSRVIPEYGYRQHCLKIK
jgi:hypothetical protein